ncbi:LOW QUALITY PROTEIN: Hypothetical protein PHPALM_12432 [Phytophthora palmivora]|uniref:Uncharacterized protein n=1 Tax=Phytophthora palmivora TaxID=4796 RepID=A0A2P4XZR0_9STRA|nr:LOW QUALITY PROTEIN: Hypothetical protein PHPALM_12432 [Phytophthora palmivora]
MERLWNALGAEGLDECVCAVCDRVVLRCDAEKKDGSDRIYMNGLREVLGEASSDIPLTLLDQYRAPSLISGLENVMVSTRGIQCYIDDYGYPDCNSSIRPRKLPKFAIANGFFMGDLPNNLQRFTIPERLLTQLSTLSAITRVMRGGHHRCIRSLCITSDCTPGLPLQLLPRSLAYVKSYRIVMTSHKDNYEKSGRCIAYEIVLFVKYLISTSPTIICTQCVICESDEESVVERRVGLTNASSHVLARDHPAVVEVGGGPQSERVFIVHRSDKFANDIAGDLFAKLFPHLFPFGRGRPGECRRVAVSVKECVKYYIALSGRKFAEDELFTLVTFDRISLQNMFIHNSFLCKRFPHIYEEYENISGEQLESALLTNERRQGRLPLVSSSDYTVNRFLKTVEIASCAVWGSNAERSRCRQRAFAIQSRFGQPALFVTLTPNTDNSFVMAQYTGVSYVTTRFDVLDATMPTKVTLREASLGNDCVAARIFMRQVDAFITHVLGIDPTTKKPTRHSPVRLRQRIFRYGGNARARISSYPHSYLVERLSSESDNANALRMDLCKRDDDPFQNDYLTPLIEMIPPSPSDGRMSKESLDYMVAVLVLLLNQHWWCHTSSCFKQSKSTASPNLCRYSFPRERVKCTHFDLSGIETKRDLGHEFINGFNYTIMATFKCNHDIQVLLGGRDATDRIYYCYKTSRSTKIISTPLFLSFWQH